ncbi:MAG: phenylalanine--tRNA ligase subunit beta [bacterium]
MIISYNWLADFVDLPIGPEETAELLTMLGLEVESMTHYRGALDKVVVGRVVECSPIAGSETMKRTRVDVGTEILPIVCGAPNVREGMTVAVALPSAMLPIGTEIRATRILGQESRGMLVSEAEIGMSPDAAGILEGDADWPLGATLASRNIAEDTVFDVEVTPNRPDFLSHFGVARDLAAKLRLPLREPEIDLHEVEAPTSARIRVILEDPSGCPRYGARFVEGITIRSSPFEMRLRLSRCGLRPISNIVDVTNYVMLELGHPLHAFDYALLQGGEIRVRCARPAETFLTLDGKVHSLRLDTLLICDARRAVAMAGVMGGLNSEIRESTRDVLIECAYFDPVSIRRTSRFLEISTDSSRRFERGVDPNGVPRVIDRTAALMAKLSGGKLYKSIVDEYPEPIEPLPIAFRPERARALVGVDISDKAMEEILAGLGCEVEKSDEAWIVMAPTFRPDLTREVDLIEEVVRLYGYDEIPVAITSRVPLRTWRDPLAQLGQKCADVLVSLGFLEVQSVSMGRPDPLHDLPAIAPGVAIANPVTEDMTHLQGALRGKLVHAASANWQRGDRTLRLFEMARTFHEGQADDPRTWEQWALAGVLTGTVHPAGWTDPPKPVDFFELKGVVETLCQKISLDNYEIFCYDTVSEDGLKGVLKAEGDILGELGIWSRKLMAAHEIDAEVAYFEFSIDALLRHVRAERKIQPLPRFPAVFRDIAVVVEEDLPAQEVRAAIQRLGGESLKGVELFDLYRGEQVEAGRKSLAFRLEFLDSKRTLTAEEAEQSVERIVAGLKEEFQAIRR